MSIQKCTHECLQPLSEWPEPGNNQMVTRTEQGEMNSSSTEGTQGIEDTACETILNDLCHYTFAQIQCTTLKSEPEHKLCILSDFKYERRFINCNKLPL